VVRYNVRDDTGQNIELVAKAYWVPQLESMRLLSPQSLRTVQGNIVTVVCHGTLPQGEPSFAEILVRTKGTDWLSSAPMQRLAIPYNPQSNLPELRGSLPVDEEQQVMALSGVLQVTDEANRNLTGAQKELLKWHCRLGHVGFQWLQWLFVQDKSRYPTRTVLEYVRHQNVLLVLMVRQCIGPRKPLLPFQNPNRKWNSSKMT
jgi:hypothetical protein